MITIPNEMVGDLYFLYNGEERTPSNLYFLAGYYNSNEAGFATTHFDNALRPVFLCRNRQRLWRPEWQGLSADFKNGFVCNFHE